MTQEEIRARLSALGMPVGDLDLAIEDVQKMIIAKAFIRFIPRLTPELQQELNGKAPEQIMDYLKQNPGKLPGFSEAEIEKIVQETWDGYFTAMEKVGV